MRQPRQSGKLHVPAVPVPRIRLVFRDLCGYCTTRVCRPDIRILRGMSDSARTRAARRLADRLRRYQQYEALRPFTCAHDPDHYLLEPYAVAGDVLLVCPTCGHADLFTESDLPDLSERVARAAAFWRGIPQ